ncbi:MAG: hypothetical protein KDJ52_00220 [Anaerolineae bacterium]|nr:hypothetical protein [Anaerolineae bacterium]
MPINSKGNTIDLTEQARAMTEAQGNPWTQPTALNSRFGPGQPVLPEMPEEQPRLFEYQAGINLISIPRAGFGLTPFPVLRNLAKACKEIRLNIELIKREIRALEWEIIAKDEKDKNNYSADIDLVTEWLDSPDGQHDFDQWLNSLLEEMLTIDAVTVWPEVTLGNQVQAAELVAGDTIRPLLDFRGRIAPPPLPAYIQNLHGLPTSYFTRDRLIYKPFNASASSPYGTSPIEFIILAVNLALRRDTYHVGSFTEGNVPEALVGAPSTWTQEMVDAWQKYWDAMVAGNMEAQRKMHWVPLEGGRGQVPVYEFRKDDINQTPRDEWLMKVACWAFGNSPAEFGITPGDGLGGAGFTASMENVQYRSMLGPITQYLTRLLNNIIQQWLKKPHLKHRWVGLDPQDDQYQQAQVDEIYTRMGVYDVSYVQDRIGIPPESRPVGTPTSASSPWGLVPNVAPVMLPSGAAAPKEGAATQKFFQRVGQEWSRYG